MWVLSLLGHLGAILAFVFMTVAIATGLYYISELIEEHTVQTHCLLTRLIHLIIALFALLYLFDSLPLTLTLLSIASHLLYLLNLRSFPSVSLSSPAFLMSIPTVILNHFLWFRHFQNIHTTAYTRAGAAGYAHADVAGDVPNFKDVASFFGIMVWLVPFGLFISLSANDHVLPTIGAGGVGVSVDGLGVGRPADEKRAGMFKAGIDGVAEWFGAFFNGIPGRANKRNF